MEHQIKNVDIAGFQLLVVNTIEKWNGFSLEA